MRDTRCSHLRRYHQRGHHDVRIVPGRNGTTVYKLGPTFAEPVEAPEHDPTPELLRTLERQRQNT